MIHQITDRERELAAERDRYQEAADKMAAEHKVERDALAAENERLKAAAKLALDALEEVYYSNDTKAAEDKYTLANMAIRNALADHSEDKLDMVAQPAQQQEPVGVVEVGSADHGPFVFYPTPHGVDTLTDGKHNVYTSPPQCKPLTTEQYTSIAHRIASRYVHRSDPTMTAYTFLPHTLEQFVRAIEAAIKEQP